jgi:sec-independent protein translocase protein TatB
MFDIGFSELLLVAVVALVVLGPERLPRAARFAGLWVRRARAQWFAVKSELERELAAEELQRSLRETRGAMARGEAELRAAGAALQRDATLHGADAATDRDTTDATPGAQAPPAGGGHDDR